MKTKHTQNKWHVKYCTTGKLPYLYQITDKQETDEEAEANAKLIAAAPELLDALIKSNDFIKKLESINPEFMHKHMIVDDGIEREKAIKKAIL